jgi:hypothetical protein
MAALKDRPDDFRAGGLRERAELAERIKGVNVTRTSGVRDGGLARR